MNLQQLEYIVAVEKHRHFARAADASFVTQPTLSMMIQKLEDELDVKIFDRKKQPVEPTKEGEEIILRAKQVLAEVAHLKEFASELKGEITGELRLGIIPTLAPYLLPLFLKPFSQKYPQLKIYIKEMVTNDIIARLKTGDLDMGILATPVHEDQLTEHPLFYEEFFAYASKSEKLGRKKYLAPKEINIEHLWLLEEGHCLRNQVFNLCELKKQEDVADNLHYEAGSIETLINLVDKYEGVTIIPHFATLNLTPAQKENVREFAEPKPVREISLVVSKSYPRKKMLQNLKAEILTVIPFEVNQKKKSVLEI
ncbi:LysR family transcriptional regulator [Adhaeribacter sp. BT258]|uniref:LysR family transcriptional regulator n=1 Tax=Adhaeribacter terrigena TaxID=2793070 RepID=A0ABS1C254_9BACT|nr:hydrogen peroxide-inducible genes activator [Adhaeribacter terrigena]MBK0403479.1 LysR family transcriptional regulator [Adhaeribacter terrigena]